MRKNKICWRGTVGRLHRTCNAEYHAGVRIPPPAQESCVTILREIRITEKGKLNLKRKLCLQLTRNK